MAWAVYDFMYLMDVVEPAEDTKIVIPIVQLYPAKELGDTSTRVVHVFTLGTLPILQSATLAHVTGALYPMPL